MYQEIRLVVSYAMSVANGVASAFGRGWEA